MPYEDGATNTQAALKLANDEVLQERKGMRNIEKGISKIIIVLTDGGSNVDAGLTIPNAKLLKNREFSIISVGIGNDINQTELDAIASTKQDVYNVDGYDRVNDILEGLLKTTCQQPAQTVIEKPIKGSCRKNSYKYYKLKFDDQNKKLFNITGNESIKFTIGLKNLIGSTGLTSSFEDENPKEKDDFIDNKPNGGNLNGNYVEKAHNIQKKSIQENLYQIDKPEDKDSLYFGVKGYEDDNEFEVLIYNRQVTKPIPNGEKCIHKAFGKLNILLLLLVLVIFY